MKYLMNTSWALIDKITRLVTVLLISILLARYLGVKRFGDFNFAISLVGILSIFSTLGLDSIIVKEIVEDKRNQNKVLGTSAVLKMAGALIIICVIVLSSVFMVLENEVIILILLLSSANIFHSFKVIDFYFQSQIAIKLTAIVSVIVQTLAILLYWIFIKAGLGLTFFGLIVVIESSLFAIGLIVMYQTYVDSVFKWSFDKRTIKKLLGQSWPLILTGLFISIYMKIDQVMIKFILDSTEVGYYSAAVRISEAWYFFPMVVTSSIFPAILELKKKSEKRYLERIQNLYDFMLVISVFVGIVVTIFGRTLINLVYGNSFEPSADVLIIHIWSGLFVSLGLARGKWILAENLQVYTIFYLLGGCLMNIILNVIFIPFYGSVGAAIASLLSQITGVLIVPLFFKKTRISSIMILKSFILFSYTKRLTEWTK